MTDEEKVHNARY